MFAPLRRYLRHSSLVASALLFGATTHYAFAQETNTETLTQRLERLERENRELERQVEKKLRETTTPVSTEGAIDAKSVENIVSRYLEQQAEVKKKDEGKKNEFVAVGSDLNFKATWKDGLSLSTPNNDFKVGVGGRLQLDMGTFHEDKATMPAFHDAAGFRRARLKADGTMWEVFNWFLEVDFANNGATADRAFFTDVYGEFTQLPVVGNIRVGRFKEQISFEELISDNYVSFMERSAAHQAFIPSRSLGIMAYRTFGDEQRITLASGLYRDDTSAGIDPSAGNGGFGQGDGEYSITTRATFAPIYENDGRCLVHIGGAYSRRNFFPTGTNGVVTSPSYSSQAEIRLGTPALLSTKAITNPESVNLWGGEFAAQYGPVWIHSDIYVNQVDREDKFGKSLPSPLWWGGYVQAGVFLTGEHRPYSRATGVFSRVKPHENFFRVRGEDGNVCSGWGAWEVIARASYLDLHDDVFVVQPDKTTKVGGTGIQRDYTLGVNWYWNPNMRWMFNYIHANRSSDGGSKFSGNVDVLAARFAVDF